MNIRILPLCCLAFALVAVSGCADTKLAARAQLPPPLIDKLPARVGVYYSKEFREFVHKETRNEVEYEITLGPAHVQNLDWLLKAMFSDVVQIEDPTKVADLQPPLVMILEPRFEEYSFLTPKDVAGEAFIVTIRYLLTVYDGGGARVDAFTFTGYGREKGGSFSSKEPLQIATQRAMRDAGAKVAVELTDQESVRLLLRIPRELIAPPPDGAPLPAVEAPPPATEAPQPAEVPPPSAGR